MENNRGIKYFPISFFSVILGMAGFTIAYQKAEKVFEIPFHISPYILVLTSLLFIIILIIYLIKIIRFASEVKAEFGHPIKLSFFPTFSISLLLLSITFLHFNASLSKYLWIIGAVLHLIFTIKIISIWIQDDKFHIKHINPSWFIPAVGNILVPLSGVHFFFKRNIVVLFQYRLSILDYFISDIF